MLQKQKRGDLSGITTFKFLGELKSSLRNGLGLVTFYLITLTVIPSSDTAVRIQGPQGTASLTRALQIREPRYRKVKKGDSKCQMPEPCGFLAVGLNFNSLIICHQKRLLHFVTNNLVHSTWKTVILEMQCGGCCSLAQVPFSYSVHAGMQSEELGGTGTGGPSASPADAWGHPVGL